MKIVEHRVVLQYPGEGTSIGNPEYKRTTHVDDANKFVDLDSSSGGYPYSTSLERAHNFKTEAEAIRYQGALNEGFIVRHVTVSYEW